MFFTLKCFAKNKYSLYHYYTIYRLMVMDFVGLVILKKTIAVLFVKQEQREIFNLRPLNALTSLKIVIHHV
jgi:hypothetical protein